MKLFLTCYLFILPLIIFCNDLVIDGEKEEYSLENYCYNITDFNDNLGIDDVLNGDWKFLDDGPKFGYSLHYQWIKININNPTDTELERYLFIPYSHINEIVVYVINNGNIISKQRLGTSVNSNDKIIKSRGYPFKVNLKEKTTTSLIVRLDHRFLPLRASSFLTTQKRLREIVNGTESLIWFWRGIFIFAILIALILYFSVKLKLFLYYFLFNISFLIFLGTELGDFFLFWDIDPTNHISDIKHIGNYFAIYFLPFFLNELTPLKQLNPKMWKGMYLLGIPLAIMIPLGFIPSLKNTLYYFITDVYMLSWAMIVLILLLIFLIPAMRKRKRNALTLFSIYSFYIGVLILDVILPAIGLASESPNVHNALLTGSIFEILTFLFLMGKEAIGVYKERALLLEKHKYHQREMLTAIVESQEKERNRVGRELHDMVGANMSVIKQHIAKENTQLRSVINNTIESVRSLSHGLVTPRVNSDEFIDEITELCSLASNNDIKFYPFFHDWNELKDTDFTTHLFRIIQELVQNAVKHSQAKNVHIQLLREGENLSIMYEDDGIGCDFQNPEIKGLELKG